TAGTLPSRRRRRAAPLPKSVRACAVSRTSAMSSPSRGTCDNRKGLSITGPEKGHPRRASPPVYRGVPEPTETGVEAPTSACEDLGLQAPDLHTLLGQSRKRLVTEPSLNTSVIARAISGAMGSTVSLSKRCSEG